MSRCHPYHVVVFVFVVVVVVVAAAAAVVVAAAADPVDCFYIALFSALRQ